MGVRKKSIRFGCILAASLIVLLLAGCDDASESGSSQTAQPPKEGRKMGLFFQDMMYERQATATLGYAFYGGSEPGEVLATVRKIREGDAESWHREWNTTADRLFELAEKSVAAGHRVSAREAYLRACIYYHASFVFLFGTPVDQRLIGAFDKGVEAFEKAAVLFEPPIEPVEIPYEGTTLPGYFYRVDDSGRPRPTVIAINGYDSTIQAMHFGHAVEGRGVTAPALLQVPIHPSAWKGYSQKSISGILHWRMAYNPARRLLQGTPCGSSE
jgi:hypothetical protein